MPGPRLLLSLLLAAPLAACGDASNGASDDTGAPESTGTTGTTTDATTTEPTTGSTGATTDAPEADIWGTPYCHPVKDGPAWPEPFPGWEDEVLQLVNEARAVGHDCDSKGMFGPAAPLVTNASLRCAARKHAADMATRDYFDHVSPEGETFIERIVQAGYGSYAEIGENIAGGLDIDTPQVAVAGWLASDGHCANIMNPGFTELGAGAYEGAGALTFYWTQEFGRPN